MKNETEIGEHGRPFAGGGILRLSLIHILLEGHIKHCVRDGIEHGDADKIIENFTKAVERFSNMG